LPAARRVRYETNMGLSAKDARNLTGERVVADFFEACVRLSDRPKECSNWIQNELFNMVGDAEIGATSFAELSIKPFDLVSVIQLVEKGTIATNAGRTLLRAMARTGKSAKVLVVELGLEQVQDAGAI